MNSLLEALGLLPPVRLNLVGGGGKTSAMYRLGQELADLGQRAILTTTTNIFPPAALPLVLANSRQEFQENTQQALEIQPQIVAGQGLESGKVKGIPPHWAEPLAESFSVICEADGSKGRPLKFPAAHEPVLCAGFSLVLVVGLRALFKPFGEEIFHRPELARQHLGWRDGLEITPALLADLITHPLAWGRLPSPFTVLLNQADTQELREMGERAGTVLLKAGIQRVVLASLALEKVYGVSTA
jgi:probable selenium-dependent hydroxylase accessory protein YqeC